MVEAGSPLYANFPKNHPLHLGFDLKPFLSQADLFLLIGSKAPWYPPSAGPHRAATVVAIDEQPLKPQMVYQNLGVDLYLEGDLTTTPGSWLRA